MRQGRPIAQHAAPHAVPLATQRGFTLLEVMVALILVGVGFTMALSAMSGSLKLARLASEHENAMLLAKARLDEITQYPDYRFISENVSSDVGEVYGGTEYSYKIEFRPVPLLDQRTGDRVKLPFRLEEVSITVYWGGDPSVKDKSQEKQEGRNSPKSYTLTTYKMTRPEDDKKANPPPGGAAPPPTGGAAAASGSGATTGGASAGAGGATNAGGGGLFGGGGR